MQITYTKENGETKTYTVLGVERESATHVTYKVLRSNGEQGYVTMVKARIQ